MKIGIDARLMGPNCRGIGRYVERLLSHLAALDNKNEYVVFTRKEAAHLVPKNMRVVITDIRWYSFAEQMKLGKIIDAEDLDLIHVPHWNAPIFLKTPLVVTIHDMILWEHPSLASTTLAPLVYWAKYLFYRLVVSQNAKRAKIIFAVSESAKNSILRNLNVSPEKIVVTPLGVDPFVISHSSLVIRPYILSVGSGYPHKNMATFFKVFERLTMNDERLTAVVTGTDHAFLQQLKIQAHDILGNKLDRVKFLGLISDAELGELYRNANALIFTSQAEGFGLPPLEAALCGTPVIASDIDTSREMLGNAISLVAPDDARGYVAAYQKIAKDPAHKASILSALRTRAEGYSWERMAKITINAFEKLFPLV